jgi:DNA-binding transcriptional regulator YbjK
MRYIEDQVPQLVQTFSYLFQAQTNALMSRDYDAYFMLVDQLETMTVAALNKQERENLRKVKKIIRNYTKHLSEQYNTDSEFKEGDEEKAKFNEFLFVRDVVMKYPLKKLISRICTSALSKTLMEKIIPRDADNYDFNSDLQDELEEIAFNLESYGVRPLVIEDA